MTNENCDKCAGLENWMVGTDLDELPNAEQPKQKPLYYRWEITTDPEYTEELNDALYYVLGYHSFELEPMPKPHHVGVRVASVQVEEQRFPRWVITAHCFECTDESDTPPMMLRMVYRRLRRKVSELFPHVKLELPLAPLQGDR